ncbi:MAG: hypothetical protein QXP78_03900 [Candidatus Bathyarchaeia archaeon]
MKVVNVVASANFGHRLDLQAIYEALFKNIYFHQAGLKRVVWKFKDVTFMFFESGVALCLGAKGSKQAIQSLKKAVNALLMNGIVTELNKIKFNIINLVACENLNINIDLEKLALKLPRCIYEPELFPALIYKDEANAATFLIFSNGKITIAGLKDEYSAMESIRSFVKNFMEGKINE